MKTFKLKSLEIIDDKDDNIIQHEITLIDGLIINREDDYNRWVIEAFMSHDNLEYFQRLRSQKEEVMVQVTISKESNPPATFLTSIIGINEIGAHMNVLFMGTIVDQQKGIIKDMLRHLIDQGYQGESLLEKFKELI
ncbi:YwpF family protein [Virgibacillus byunsanensis]|uniref:YwpF family protein n=1 Tax=Virgibacillus byunsanensis TaxID=570945 RepID=A0ABW3LKX5_9BACI